MKRLMILAVVAGVISALGPNTAVALSKSKARCHDVDADFTSELATEACDSPLGLCASGRIKHDALLKGSMFVTISDGVPAAGIDGEPLSMLSVAGTRSLTPQRGGTLTAHVTGVFDTAQVIFSELNVITGGTGLFAGATGTLNVFGRATSPTTFAGDIRGTICVP